MNVIIAFYVPSDPWSMSRPTPTQHLHLVTLFDLNLTLALAKNNSYKMVLFASLWKLIGTFWARKCYYSRLDIW